MTVSTREVSNFLAEALGRDGVDLRLNARAVAVRTGAGERGRHVVELSEGHRGGRSPADNRRP